MRCFGRRCFLVFSAAVFFLLRLTVAVLAEEEKALSPLSDRYFFSGDGSIHLINAHTTQSAQIRYRLSDGVYPAEARQQIDRLFGVPAGSKDRISLRLVSVLDYIEDHYRQPIEIISGYRSPEYNEKLRAKGRLAAKTSMHIEGMAADIRMRKVLSAEWFQMLKTMGCCGVGYYHDNSLHVDTGPVRYWDETTSKVRTNIAQHNKQIIVRTEHDIYRAGEVVEMRLARITDYPVGVIAEFSVLQERQEQKERTGDAVARAFVLDGGKSGCSSVQAPAQRTFKWTVPADFHSEGKIRLRLRLCQRAYPEMPEQIESNSLQIRPGT